jgi:hypothetical protein
MNSGLDRSHRHVQQARRLLLGEPKVELQGENRPVVWVESGERALQLPELDVVIERIDSIDPSINRLRMLRCPECGSYYVAAEPGSERGGVAQSAQASPGAEQRFLHDIGAIGRSACDQAGAAECPRQVWLDQAREGLCIAGVRQSDEVGLG